MSAYVVIVFGFSATEQEYDLIDTEDTIRKMADDEELKWNQDNFGEEEEENEDKTREEKKGKEQTESTYCQIPRKKKTTTTKMNGINRLNIKKRKNKWY